MTPPRFLVIPAIVALCAGCDGSGPVAQPPEADRLSLNLLTVKPLLPRPWGLALDPTGSLLVVSDFYDKWIYALDAETYEPIGDTIVAGEVRGIVFDSEAETSRMLVAGERSGLTVWDVSSDGRFTLHAPFNRDWTSFIFRNERTGGMYGTVILPGNERVVVRLRGDGSYLAHRPLQASVRAGLATTEDGAILLALEDEAQPPQLLVLDASDLSLLAAVETPSWASHIVPLDGHRAAVVGGNPLDGPLLAVIDWEEGNVDSTVRFGRHPGREGFDLGRGNVWARVDASTVLIGTTHGILAIDTQTGGASHVDGEFDDGAHVNECCSMVWDAGRKRLLVASSISTDRESGRLEVYHIAHIDSHAEVP